MPNPADPALPPHEFSVSGVVFEWRGPAPYHFLAIGGDVADAIRHRSVEVSYGWGMIPVSCRAGSTAFTTSLWPKGDEYYLPLKDAVRAAEHIVLGDHLAVDLSVAGLPERG